jgi:hypothetical protein
MNEASEQPTTRPAKSRSALPVAFRDAALSAIHLDDSRPTGRKCSVFTACSINIYAQTRLNDQLVATILRSAINDVVYRLRL